MNMSGSNYNIMLITITIFDSFIFDPKLASSEVFASVASAEINQYLSITVVPALVV